MKPQDNNHKRIHILSIDGGGIRGIIPATVLAYIERNLKNKKHITECFDIISGTSTGALIALALNTPDEHGNPKYCAKDLVAFYEELGTKVFTRSIAQRIKSIWGWMGPKYSSDVLYELLDQKFGDTELKDSIKNIMIPAYDITIDKNMFFKKNKAMGCDESNIKFKDLGVACTAAPTYFKPAQIESVCKGTSYVLIDGGISVNNPAMATAVYATELYGYGNDFLILSLGTGTTYGYGKKTYDPRVNSSGFLAWVEKILPTMMHAVNDITDHEMDVVFNHMYNHTDYYRLQTIIDPAHSDLDNASADNIWMLKTYAQNLISDNKDVLQEIIDVLDTYNISDSPY